MKTTTNVGSIRTRNGSLSVSFERGPKGAVLLYAFDPSDRRKAGVHFRLGPDDYIELKSLFGRLESAQAQEKVARRQVDLIQISESAVGRVLVKIQDAEIRIPSELYSRLLAVNDGEGLLATASLVAEEMPWLQKSAAVLVATAIASSSSAGKNCPN